MPLITVPRVIVFLLFLFILGGSCIIPFAVFIKRIGGVNVREANGDLVIVTLFAAILFLLLFIFILYKASFFLVISVNKTKRKISFFYPLRFKRETYDFNDLLGFHFSSFEIKSQPIKMLVFRTADGKSFKISDFEISNLRKFEVAALQNFNLLRTDSLTPFEPEAKASFLKNTNRKFDFEQAKESVFNYFIIIGVILFGLIFNRTSLTIQSRKFSTEVLIGICALLSYFIYKLWIAYRVMRKNR